MNDLDYDVWMRLRPATLANAAAGERLGSRVIDLSA
jgi:hypothetical protein